MTEIENLVVFGDSFCSGASLANAEDYAAESSRHLLRIADYNMWPEHWKITWGGQLACRRGLNYLNLAHSGGSNQMILRKMFEFFTNNSQEFVSKSLVLVFFTGTHRMEITKATVEPGQDVYIRVSPLWDYSNDKTHWVNSLMTTYIKEAFNEDASQWQSFQHLMTSFMLLTHYNATFLAANSIIDLDETYRARLIEMFPAYEQHFNIADVMNRNPHLRLPCHHPNLAGHAFLCDTLLTLLHERNIL